MSEAKHKAPDNVARTFEQKAQRQNAGLFAELLDLLLHNKKWWLIPIILVLLAIGILVLIGSTAAAPFIYPLF
ncbi:MAG: DUF5989 family protein [Phycisphaerales bacterium]